MSEHRHRHLPPETLAGINRAPSVDVVQMVVVRFTRGEGCCDQDIAREVTAFYDMDGRLVFELDMMGANQP